MLDVDVLDADTPPDAPSFPHVQPRVLISGYYGFNNLGDELILHVLIEQLKARNLHITVISKDPEQTRAQYGVQAIDRWSPVEIIRAMARSHLFISGGGGLFQDATGPMSVVYYGGLIYLAKFFELPICFFGQGLGPLRRPISRFLTQKALQCCRTITVRDEASAGLVEELIGERPQLALDPVWLLDLPNHKPDAAVAEVSNSPWVIGISLRPWPDLTEERLDSFARFLSRLVQQSTRTVQFVLLPFQHHEDTPILDQFGKMLRYHNIQQWRLAHADQVLEEIPQCHLLFGMRFHSLLLGILSDVAVYGLIYDPKVRHLINMLGLQGTDITLMEHMDELHVQDYFNHYPLIDLDTLRKSAYQNFTALDALIAQQNFSEFVVGS